jgi:sporulation integral membrane protein YlbJ
MRSWKIRGDSRWSTLLIGLAAGLLVMFIVMFPDQVFRSSLEGLNIWWKIVFPALLPFLVLSEVLIAFGVVHFLGVLLEPFMRFFFRVPGIGGWAVAMGFTAGYPAGAQVTRQLRMSELVGRGEGERLLALSHTCNLVFIVSVVAVGFYQHAELGAMIAAVHFLSALIVGLIMRFHGRKDDALPPEVRGKRSVSARDGWIRRAFRAMYEARQNDGRTFGKLLGDAVTASVQTLMAIGGYMMIFSVVLKVLSLTKISSIIEEVVRTLLVPLGFIESLSRYTIPGMFEVNLGAYAISQSGSSSLVWQAALIGAILAFSGLCMHAQVKSIIRSTDISYTPFLVSRIMHAILAFFLTFWLWKPLNVLFSQVKPSYIWLTQQETPAAAPTLWITADDVSRMAAQMSLLVFLMIGISAMLYIARRH